VVTLGDGCQLLLNAQHTSVFDTQLWLSFQK